jgi:hypothetical protein
MEFVQHANGRNLDRLGEAEREKDIAQSEVVDRIREHEAIKLIRIKEGLFKVIFLFTTYSFYTPQKKDNYLYTLTFTP